jgi:exopolysaccharide biosynthesis polyprenyl glycosylphosphotransferase
VQRIPYLSLTSGTALAPRERAAVEAEVGVGVGVEGESALVDDRRSPHAVVTRETAALDLSSEPAEVPPSTPEPTPQPPERATGNRLLRTRLFAVDLVAVGLCWIWAGSALLGAPSALDRFVPGVAAAVITLIAMRVTGLYRSRLCVRRGDELWRIVVAGLWGAAGFVTLQEQVTSHGPQALVCAGCFVVAATTFRWQFGRWLRARRAEGRYLRSVVLIGSNDDAALLRTMLGSEPELGYVVAGVIGDSHGDPAWSDLPTSASIADIPRLAAATGASGILIVPYAVSSATTKRAISIAASWNLHVQVWPGFRGIGSRRLRDVSVSGEAFFYVEPRLSSRWQLAAKRALDVIGATTVLVLAAPLVAVAALLVKLEDRGPAFHSSERIGMHGKPFRVHKIRSMSAGDRSMPSTLAALNERTDGPLFKASNDPRVTKVGRFLRASSIDELPQLWNVLKGTMSLVGPRPALPSEAAQFDEELQRRHSVRPGITGLWQVEARQNPSFNAYRRLDLRYVDNWSLYLDISILLSTVPSVASQAVRAFLRSRRT